MDGQEAMKDGGRDEENPSSTAWEDRCDHILGQKHRERKIAKQVTQVKQPGETKPNPLHHSKKGVAASVRQVLVENTECVKTLKPALTAR